MNSNYNLENIDIPEKCKVVKNVFTTYDPSINYNEDDSLYNLQEDLLQIIFDDINLIVDLGWYGDFETNIGCFKIYIIKDFDWEDPLKVISSQSQSTIAKNLNQIFSAVSNQEF
ncbi:MAG: hypothetical protein ACPGVD_05175 [Flavobacteriales bacterium]